MTKAITLKAVRPGSSGRPRGGLPWCLRILPLFRVAPSCGGRLLRDLSASLRGDRGGPCAPALQAAFPATDGVPSLGSRERVRRGAGGDADDHGRQFIRVTGPSGFRHASTVDSGPPAVKGRKIQTDPLPVLNYLRRFAAYPAARRKPSREAASGNPDAISRALSA